METPRDVALHLLEQADEFLVLVPNGSDDFTYIWVVSGADRRTAFQNALKDFSS